MGWGGVGWVGGWVVMGVRGDGAWWWCAGGSGVVQAVTPKLLVLHAY